jgi:hypothetical protein
MTKSTGVVVALAIERIALCGYPVVQRNAQNGTFDVKSTVRPMSRWPSANAYLSVAEVLFLTHGFTEEEISTAYFPWSLLKPTSGNDTVRIGWRPGAFKRRR